jgi:hypothetical protein
LSSSLHPGLVDDEGGRRAAPEVSHSRAREGSSVSL